MVTGGRSSRLEDLFARAIEQAPDARARFVEEETASDPDLRVELESLLAYAEATDGAIHRAIGSAAATFTEAASAKRIGRFVGPYKLTGVLGEGGMGTVYIAERHDGEYHSRVAIKLMHAAAMAPLMLARFRAERQVLAKLDHPGIVRLLDGGTTCDGTPYFVMEHVDGTPLTRYARDISIRDRVRLVLEIAGALQYAHQKLVVHRDIKPSNILVDRNGAPKVLDFGIAKFLGEGEEVMRQAATRTGIAPFTLEYASPEQLRAEPVTVATDVYSLGAVLYELLTDMPPQRAGANFGETLTNICEREPPLPSSVASIERRRELVGDLDSITMKALQRAPVRRFGSMALFAEDLCRYLDGLPVTAHEASARYRAGKFVARHRGKLALATAIVVALTGATAISILQARRADLQAAASERDKRALLRERGLQELMSGRAFRALPYLAEAMREGDDSTAMRFLLAEAMRPLHRELATSPIPEGAVVLAIAPDETRFAVGTMSGRVIFYDERATIIAQVTLGSEPVRDLAFSADGRRVVAGSEGGELAVWDTTQMAPRRVLATTAKGTRAVGFVDDGHAVATVSSTGEIAFIGATSDQMHTAAAIPMSIGAKVMVASCTEHARRVAVGTSDGGVYVWDGGKPTRIGEHHGAVQALRLSGDGHWLVSGGDDHTAQVWNLAAPRAESLVLQHRSAVTGVDLSMAGTVATASADGAASIWDIATGRIVTTIQAHPGHRMRALHLAADGNFLLTVGEDATSRLWNAATGQSIMVMESDPGAGNAGHSVPGAHDAQLANAGNRIVTVEAKHVRIWRVDQAPLEIDLAVGFPAASAAYGPDGNTIAVAGGLRLAIWDLATRTQREVVDVPQADLVDVTWRPDGSRILVVGAFGMARVYDVHGRLVHALQGHSKTQKVHRGAWSPDGRLIVTAGNDGAARVWDAESGEFKYALPHPEAVMAAAWHPDGTRIVTSCRDRRLRIWDAATGALHSTLEGHGMQFLDVTYSPDGLSLATAGRDGDGAIWDVASGYRRMPLEGHTDVVIMAVWSPDGHLVATSADNGTMGIWDPLTGALLAMRSQPGEPLGLVWSHDGKHVMVASNDGHVRIWDVTLARESPQAVSDFVARRVPFRLVGARIERAALP
jgi:WD40 repeat protein/tRNA A-37 threonylcarbamoyl transferase component Bud32